MAETKTAKKTTKRSTAKRKKLEAAPKSRGVAPDSLGSGTPPPAVARLATSIEEDGGSVLSTYRDPLGGHWQIFAGLPIDLVEPTPYQRDLSEAHVAKLSSAIDRLGRYIDPMVVVRTDEGKYWTPNGNHRLAALRTLGAQAAVAIVVPEHEVARRILLLNTEKAHNLRERALEVARLADQPRRAGRPPRARVRGRVRGAGAHHARALLHGERAIRRRRLSPDPQTDRQVSRLGAAEGAGDPSGASGAKVIELDAAVSEAVAGLKARGFESPYLRPFVVARINPIRFKRGAKVEFDETIDKMLASAQKFDVGKIRQDQVARAGGASEES